MLLIVKSSYSSYCWSSAHHSTLLQIISRIQLVTVKTPYNCYKGLLLCIIFLYCCSHSFMQWFHLPSLYMSAVGSRDAKHPAADHFLCKIALSFLVPELSLKPPSVVLLVLWCQSFTVPNHKSINCCPINWSIPYSKYTVKYITVKSIWSLSSTSMSSHKFSSLSLFTSICIMPQNLSICSQAHHSGFS